MSHILKNDLNQLMRTDEKCCISIYMPTHRSPAETEQDQIRFKNLLNQAEKRANEMEAAPGVFKDRFARARRLLQNESFWLKTTEGLALFISAEQFFSYQLPVKFEELLVSANRFHIKPVLPLLSENGRFHILALSQNSIRLFQCSRFSDKEIDMPGVAGGLIRRI
jgi:hypothetical protein